jgi:hypothetical protein
MDESFIEGYLAFKEQIKDNDGFYDGIAKFKALLNSNGRNIASRSDYKHFEELELQAELEDHISWIDSFTEDYTKQ